VPALTLDASDSISDVRRELHQCSAIARYSSIHPSRHHHPRIHLMHLMHPCPKYGPVSALGYLAACLALPCLALPCRAPVAVVHSYIQLHFLPPVFLTFHSSSSASSHSLHIACMQYAAKTLTNCCIQNSRWVCGLGRPPGRLDSQCRFFTPQADGQSCSTVAAAYGKHIYCTVVVPISSHH